MKVRLIAKNGRQAYLHRYWGEDCPNVLGLGHYGYHNAKVLVAESDKLDDHDLGGRVEDYPEERWQMHCDHCGAVAPSDAEKQVFRKVRFNTESGDQEPGDCWYESWYHEEDYKRDLCRWDNCNDPRGHLMVRLPDGYVWDTDSRASNCTMKEDRTHRCWVKHGEAPDLHIDKAGNTCGAGAGSIQGVDGWHGFYHNGQLVQC